MILFETISLGSTQPSFKQVTRKLNLVSDTTSRVCRYRKQLNEQAGYKSEFAGTKITLVLRNKSTSRTTFMTNLFNELFHTVAILVFKKKKKTENETSYFVSRTHTPIHKKKV